MSSQKQKKKTKAPTGRPVSTAAISQPNVEDTSHLTSLSSFSPDGNHFAFLSLAVDKHRLRVYSTSSGQSVAEHTVENARVSAISWSRFHSSAGAPGDNDASSSPSKKKRRKKDAAATAGSEGGETQEKSSTIEVVLLGLSDGTVLIFSPSHGRILRTLTHSSSSSPILSLTTVSKPDGTSVLWTSSADGTLRFWDALKNELLGSSKTEDRIPYTFLTQRPSNEDDRIDVLAAHHSIRLLSTPAEGDPLSIKPTTSATFTGHASPIRQLAWDSSKPHPTRFASLAETDRFCYIWETPDSSTSSSEGRIVASIPLDSDARSLAFAASSAGANQKQTLLTLSASGKLSIFPVPADISPSKSSKSSPTKLPTLLSKSVIVTSAKATAAAGKIVNAAFVEGAEGKVRIARIVGGIRPVFDLVGYVDAASGEWVKEVVVEDAGAVVGVAGGSTLPVQRYTEANNIGISSGAQLAHDAEMDDAAEQDLDGALDVDLAELSLGQRLTALSGEAALPASSDESDSDDHPKRTKKTSGDAITPVPANSLTRTLIQALHSSDTRLLETCLAHTDPNLILTTVRRLPSQLSIPLIQACVERLGRGKRGAQTKGRGGAGASAQRGMGLVRWVRCVLVVHSGFLMTIPDLVARLAALHGTLTRRMGLQESLLGLAGRLDMVLAQIELRGEVVPAAPVGNAGGKRVRGQRNKAAKKVVRYVEGESESSEDEDEEAMEVEVERDEDEEGSVEDVELGGVSDSSLPEMDEDEDEDEDDEDAFSDEDEDDEEGVTMNGFIDDEAEEYSEEDEDDESDE